LTFKAHTMYTMTILPIGRTASVITVIQDEKSETKIAHSETKVVTLHNEGTSDQIKDHSRFYKGE